jgi:uncharacterized protein
MPDEDYKSNLSEVELTNHRVLIKNRQEKEEIEFFTRTENAIDIAKKAALFLKNKYNVSRVVLFGSLAKRDTFNRWSDIDIAAWGIKPENTFRAIGEVHYIDRNFEVNLVDVNTCEESLLKIIINEGIDLI